jgi:hypothetical protein
VASIKHHSHLSKAECYELYSDSLARKYSRKYDCEPAKPFDERAWQSDAELLDREIQPDTAGRWRR